MNQEGHTASVLVVEDTIENLRLLSELLGAQGYEVRAVTNGRQAIQAVEREPPDLILLDINMPELNGYEVCRHLKAQERSKDVPVIFITALTDTVDKVRAFDAGGVDYVTKPFQIEEVLARVKTHIALRRAQAELADSYTRLRAVEQLRDDLVHMVVHDLRSPLSALLINLRLLESAATLGDDDRQILQSAVGSAEAIDANGQHHARCEPARSRQNARGSGGVGSGPDGARCARCIGDHRCGDANRHRKR